MIQTPQIKQPVPSLRKPISGFSLIELMVAITISLVIMVVLIGVLVNLSRGNRELAKTNMEIENGRFAIQLLQSDIVNAGYWGSYVPQFDDLNWPFVPLDVPTMVPDPCLTYGSWDFTHRNNLLGIPLQTTDAAPAGCAIVANKTANSDVLVVRHAATCVAGTAGCDADTPGKLYFQSSQCGSGTAGIAQGGAATSITLQALSPTSTTSIVNNIYSGMIIRITSGTGAGQSRVIDTYNGTNFLATVTTPWATNPDNTSRYVILEDILDTSGFSLRRRGADCSTAAAAEKRKFVSNIYYIRNYARTAGDGVPTLVRSTFDPTGAPALAHQAAEPLIEGVEGFRIELGIDNTVTRCATPTPVNYAVATTKVNPTTCVVDTANPSLNTLPTNRGDGTPDSFVHCTSASPCSAAQLTNVVAAKLFVLARTPEPTSGYIDNKAYCLATRNPDGTCPAYGTFTPPANDRYKRHVFSSSVRLTSIAGRRETP